MTTLLSITMEVVWPGSYGAVIPSAGLSASTVASKEMLSLTPKVRGDEKSNVSRPAPSSGVAEGIGAHQTRIEREAQAADRLEVPRVGLEHSAACAVEQRGLKQREVHRVDGDCTVGVARESRNDGDGVCVGVVDVLDIRVEPVLTVEARALRDGDDLVLELVELVLDLREVDPRLLGGDELGLEF
ncbi:hypothetical protein [Rhizobium laguerreae]|uniref:hypothetical protein n=1 Tax=Rhizobium laguerreae TaxID=1076926 RepID=UPI001FE2E73B|nr:hypothetical protein [Rhizobium laguerreae]